MAKKQELGLLRKLKEKDYISVDNDPGFVDFMTRNIKSIKASGHTFLINELFKCICGHGAVKCATAIIEGRAGFSFDPNHSLLLGLYPLHLAAQTLHYGITKQLLIYGADPNLYVHDNPLKLPLNFALDALCNYPAVTHWNANISIFKLLYILFIKDLFEPLELIKFLAYRTDQLETICFQCAQAGELVKLAALLIVAWPKLGAPFADQGIKNSPIGQCILHELRMLSDQQAKLASTSTSTQHDNDDLVLLCERKDKLISAWILLKVLEVAGDGILDFRDHTKTMPNWEVPFFLSRRLIEVFHIPLTSKDFISDDVKCLMPGLPPKGKAQLFRSLEKQIRLGSTSGVTSKNCRSVGASRSRLYHTSRDSFFQNCRSVGASRSRLYHTSRDSSCSVLRSCKCDPIRNEIEKPSLPLLCANMWWSRVASAAKRIPK